MATGKRTLERRKMESIGGIYDRFGAFPKHRCVIASVGFDAKPTHAPVHH